MFTAAKAAQRRQPKTQYRLRVALVIVCVLLMAAIVAYSEWGLALPNYSGKIM